MLGGGIGDIELNEESALGNTEFAVGVVPAVPWVDEGDVCDDGLSANAQKPNGVNVADMSNHTEENSTSSNTSRSTSGKCGMTLTGNAEVDEILSNRILDEFSTTIIDGEEEVLDTSTCDGSVELHYDTELPLYEVEGAVESVINQSYSGYWPTIEMDKMHHANCFNSLKEHQTFLDENTEFTFTQFIAGTIDISSLREEYICCAFDVLSGHEPVITARTLSARLGAFLIYYC